MNGKESRDTRGQITAVLLFRTARKGCETHLLQDHCSELVLKHGLALEVEIEAGGNNGVGVNVKLPAEDVNRRRIRYTRAEEVVQKKKAPGVLPKACNMPSLSRALHIPA